MLTRSGALILLAGVLFLLYLADTFTSGGALAFAMLVFPFSLGFAAQVLFDPSVEMRKWAVFGIALVATIVLSSVLLATGVESLGCALMAFPIFFGVEFLGILLARTTLTNTPRDMPDGMKSSLLIVPFLPALFDPVLPVWQGQYTTTNTIEIAATPDVVWAQITDFPTVQDDERLWTISHNLIGAPVPLHSEVENGVRAAFWSQDIQYDEIITHRSATDMAWDIRFADGFQTHDTFQRILPNSDQFELLRGAYDMTIDGAVTTLTLTTQYRLNTTFNAYVALWGDLFLGDNHNSILHVLKLRSEREI